ncbi:hypothetical protein E1A91_D08G201900v1 [Gossypium mustelinum]|uniref:SET domain-containing protein n=1 Tax=Gossypium mustelinum TaxID=34275 RepID=A0A5D2TY51_GOSMU|nr:hypothetical protein E1A91_D08G201900v1 [Gossypium mustelinum]
MGVSDNMLHKEISMVASSSHSEGRSGRVPTEKGHVAPAPRFKQRKVSAVRDFPPGCGRVAAPITRPSDQAQGQVVSESENPASLPDSVERVQCETKVSEESENATSSVNEVSGSQKDLPEENAASMTRPSEQAQGQAVSESENPASLPDSVDKVQCETKFSGESRIATSSVNEVSGSEKDLPEENAAISEEEVPENGVEFHPGESSLARNYRPRKGVTVVRHFPPFCGRNAPPLSDEERMKWLTSLKNKGFNLDKFVNKEKPLEKTLCTDVRQAIEDVQEIYALDGKVEGSSPRLPVEEIQTKPEKSASEKVGKRGAYEEASSRNDVEENVENTNENNIKPSCETFPNEPDSNSEKVTETRDDSRGLEENPIRDIVVYEGGDSFEKKLSVSSAFEGQLMEEDCIFVNEEGNSFEKKLSDLSAFGDQLLEENHGSQEILSTSPHRQGKISFKADLAGGSLKRKKRSNATRKSSSRKRAHQGQVIVWNKEDSLEQDELHKNDNFAWRSYSYDVSLPPCPSRSDHDNDEMTTRNKVRETLRLFQAIFRKLLQEEESKMKEKGKAPKRIDILAAKILKEKGKYVNTGKQIIGPVPGIEVGDEFQYFVELNLVGLHRQSQGGIDYVKQGDKIIATSIIASGGYENDLDNSDVLCYMGQGGNVMQKGKQPEDQKLERGNLALANSRFVKNPVRVIRGETKSSSTLLEARGKTYVYDGLYSVEEFKQEPGPHGKLVYKYKLVRIPGQPELTWKVVKKSKVREGLCVHDISLGKEVIPISAINTIDSEKPPPFEYVCHMIYPDWCRPIPPKGCGCTKGCSELGKCSCVMKNEGEIPYNHNGAIVEAKPLVYECGPNCNCPPSCYNRVSQHGIKIQLEIFKTESRGWGVRSLNSISSGTFICEYAGELLEDREAEERKGNDEYLFDIGNNIDSSLWDGLSNLLPDAHSSSCQVVHESGFTIDAARCGNIGRFINHSCSPNLYAQNVLYDHEDTRIPHIMFFAAENIPPLQELTYHYNYMIDQVRDENGNIKKKICYCGSSECTGRLY